MLNPPVLSGEPQTGFFLAFAVFTTTQFRHSNSVILNVFALIFTDFQLFVVSLQKIGCLQ